MSWNSKDKPVEFPGQQVKKVPKTFKWNVSRETVINRIKMRSTLIKKVDVKWENLEMERTPSSLFNRDGYYAEVPVVINDRYHMSLSHYSGDPIETWTEFLRSSNDDLNLVEDGDSSNQSEPITLSDLMTPEQIVELAQKICQEAFDLNEDALKRSLNSSITVVDPVFMMEYDESKQDQVVYYRTFINEVHSPRYIFFQVHLVDGKAVFDEQTKFIESKLFS